MREFLWMPDRGMFGEFRDYLGLQRLHPSAALWSFYHTMDAELATPAEARQMADYVDTYMPHLPVRGPGVPTDDSYYVLATTDWMPYSWSINNVVMGENMHTALGLWQAGRAGEAFRIAKSALLASMFMGICPGNVGTLNYLDVYRREAQRDFADGGGVTSRAIVEGLFGLRPDVLGGELLIVPGLPADWDRASLRHPDASIVFKRGGATEMYLIEQRFAKPLSLRLRLPGRGDEPIVTVDGRAVAPRPIPGAEPASRFEIQSPAAPKYMVVIRWKQAAPPVLPRARSTTGACAARHAQNGHGNRLGRGSRGALQRPRHADIQKRIPLAPFPLRFTRHSETRHRGLGRARERDRGHRRRRSPRSRPRRPRPHHAPQRRPPRDAGRE